LKERRTERGLQKCEHYTFVGRGVRLRHVASPRYTLAIRYLLAAPPSNKPYNKQQAKEAEAASKKSAIESYEADSESKEKGKADESPFSNGMMISVVNSIQVSINRIHVRFEDLG
jgi:hypothetical protein